MQDSNPRAVSDLTVFKTVPFNQTWVIFREGRFQPTKIEIPSKILRGFMENV